MESIPYGGPGSWTGGVSVVAVTIGLVSIEVLPGLWWRPVLVLITDWGVDVWRVVTEPVVDTCSLEVPVVPSDGIEVVSRAEKLATEYMYIYNDV